MGLSSLSQAFLASIDADFNTRNSAEQHLNSCSSNPATPLACLTLAVSTDSHPIVQQSAAVFLKNLVLKYWKESVSRIESPDYDVSKNNSHDQFLSPNSHTLTSPSNIPISPSHNSSNHAFSNTNSSTLGSSSPFSAFSKDQIVEFKQQVLYSFRLASPIVLNNLINVFTIFLETSGIPQWHDLTLTTTNMLTDSDPNVVFSGILVCLEILRHINTLPFNSPLTISLRDDIISLFFPHLSKIAQSLSSETNSQAGLMLWKILKCYKIATYSEFPDYLQRELQLNTWLSLFLHILMSTYPLPVSQSLPKTHFNTQQPSEHTKSPSLSIDSTSPFPSSPSYISNGTSPSSQSSFPDAAEKPLDYALRLSIPPWAKCKKWACMILSYLMTTYANNEKSRSIGVQQKDYSMFSNVFIHYFAPEVSKAFITDIEKWGANKTPQQLTLLSSTSAVCAIIDYFQVVITNDGLWNQILPKMDVIASNLIFGILVYSEPDLEAFYYNPGEYILSNIENVDFSARGKDLKFLSVLVEKRDNDMFQGILILINQAFSKYHENPQNLQLCLEKDAALQVMIQLEERVTAPDSPIASQINSFIIEQVIDDLQLNSSAPQNLFLLARSCEVIAKFHNVTFSKTEQEHVLNFVLRCFNSCDAVMVKYSAAFALKTLFMAYDHVCALLNPQVSQVMQKMLELYEEINSESLSLVMEELIDTFAVQLAPFSEQLCTQLSNQFIRILTEIDDRKKQVDSLDSGDFSFVDDTQMVAVGILNALNTLLLSLEKSPSHIAKLEPGLLPVFKIVIEKSNSAFYQEIFELIDTCLYSAKSITSNMGQVVSMMGAGFKRDSTQCCEYYGPVLCNFFNFSFPNNVKQTQVNAERSITKDNNLEMTYKYVDGLTDLSFAFSHHFLVKRDADASQGLSTDDMNVAATLAQTMFLASASSNVTINAGPGQKYIIDLVYCTLTNLSQALSSVLTYRGLIEVTLSAAVYDAHNVCSFLISSNCFDWVIEMTVTRCDIFNRAYDNALVALALLNIAVACSRRTDGYHQLFPKIIKSVVGFISKYYKMTQIQNNSHAMQTSMGNYSFSNAPNSGSSAGSNTDSPSKGQFAFVSESFDTSSNAVSDPFNSNSESLLQLLESEPALENAIANFNLYAIYQNTIRFLTDPGFGFNKNSNNSGSEGFVNGEDMSNMDRSIESSNGTERHGVDDSNINSELYAYYNNTLNEISKDLEFLQLHAFIMSLPSN